MKLTTLILILLLCPVVFAQTVVTGAASTTVDLTAPGAIGGTTPAAITGTIITANTKFIAASGAVGTPSWTFSSEPTTGFYFYASGSPALAVAGANAAIFTNLYMSLYRSGSHQFGLGIVGDGIISTRSVGGYCWSSASGSAVACDTALWRTGAGVVGVGNGTPADISGTLKAAKVATPLDGLITKSPDGTCYSIHVANGGTITATSLTCP